MANKDSGGRIAGSTKAKPSTKSGGLKPIASASSSSRRGATGKRELINTATGKRFVRGSGSGQFRESDTVGVSLQVSRPERTQASSAAGRVEPRGTSRAGVRNGGSASAAKKAKTGPVERDRRRWIGVVERLVGQVEAWAKERHWSVRRDPKRVHESRLGDYTVPFLSILTPSGQVHLDPVGRHVAGGDGRVDLLAWPSLTRMLLIRSGDRWVLKTDSGVLWPEGWGKQSFERLVEALNAAA